MPTQRTSPEEVAEGIAAKRFLISHPDVFIEYYSGLKLKAFHRRIIYAINLNQRVVVLLPAGHGKSTLIAKWMTIYWLCQNPNIRIILVMKTDEEVKFYARAIRRELTSNHKLISDWGPFIPKGRDIVWSNDAIEVAKRQIREPQPTVEFASAKSIEQVLGHRCDRYLGDDIVTPTTVSTEEQREKQRGNFNEGIDTGPQYLWDRDPETGLFINKPGEIYWPEPSEYPPGLYPMYEAGALIGTVFHPSDLLHEKGRSPVDLKPGKIYRGNDPSWKLMYFDCWEHDEDDNVTEDPIWPERWSREKLKAKEASLGTVDFNKRYRNIAVADADLTFKRIWIKGSDDGEYPGCRNRTRSFGELPDIEGARWYKAIGFDPSTGRKVSGSSWSSYLALAVNLEEPEPRRRYVLDILRGQMGFDDILDTFEKMWMDLGIDKGVIEQNAAQKWLLDNRRVQSWQIERHWDIVGWETQTGTKLNPVMGVNSMQSLVREGLLDIPYATPTDREKAAPFIDQLQLFPEGIHDWVMALWFAELAVARSRRKYRAWARGPGRVETLPSAVR